MNRLIFGDNLDVLKGRVKDESVDLIYLDPPFNSNATYNLINKTPVGDPSDSQRRAFKDTWRWEEDAAPAAMEEIRQADLDLFRILQALQTSLGTSDMMAYLVMMSVRLLQMRRVLKPAGSLYLHCDPTASHYLKVILDAVFGAGAFRSELVWKRTSAHSSARRWGPVHDIILFYAPSPKFTWNKVFQAYDQHYLDEFYTHEDPGGARWRRSDLTGAGTRKGETGKPWRGIDVTAKGRHWFVPPAELDKLDEAGKIHWPAKVGGMPMLKRYLDDQRGVPAQDLILDIAPLHNLTRERLGYPTQKPVALLERILRASSNPGDVVLDPFCGCGTTIHAAEILGRQWIGIDVAYDAILVIEDRLKTWLPAAKYQLDGIPTSERDARALAELKPFIFQQWAVGRLGGRSSGKGADRGIDGEIAFLKGHQNYGRAIVSVKAGRNVAPAMMRELGGTVQREGADLGIFVCVDEPTREMRLEQARSELIGLPWGTRHKLQIVTVEDLIRGPDIGIPTALNTIAAAEHAKAQARKSPPKKPTAEQLRREPPLPPMSISGGGRPVQEGLALNEPLLTPSSEQVGRRRRR